MSKVCWFLDWSASASAPLRETIVLHETVSLSPPENLENRENLPDNVSYWRRLDGIFVFELVLVKAGALDDTQCIDLAAYVSQVIKSSLGLQNEPLNARLAKRAKPWSLHERTHGFPTISISPVKLQTKGLSDETVGDLLSDNGKTLSLIAINAGKKLQAETSAVLILRKKFASAFPKGLEVLSILRNQRLKVVGNIAPRVYSWQLYFLIAISVVFILAGIFTADAIYQSGYHDGQNKAEENATSYLAFWTKDFATKFLNIVLATFFPLLILVYIAIPANRFRKSIVALDKSINVLRLGNIYCSVIDCLDEDCPEHKRSMNFSDAIDILQARKAFYAQKKLAINGIIFALCAICARPFIDAIKEIPILGPLAEYVTAAVF